MAKIFQKGPALKQAETGKSNFKVKKNLRLGTSKAPAQISVQTEERKQELTDVCSTNGWACVIEVNAEEDENTRDLEMLQNKLTSAVSSKMANRNDPCPCQSGKKYKKCCGA